MLISVKILFLFFEYAFIYVSFFCVRLIKINLDIHVLIHILMKVLYIIIYKLNDINKIRFCRF